MAPKTPKYSAVFGKIVSAALVLARNRCIPITESISVWIEYA